MNMEKPNQEKKKGPSMKSMFMAGLVGLTAASVINEKPVTGTDKTTLIESVEDKESKIISDGVIVSIGEPRRVAIIVGDREATESDYSSISGVTILIDGKKQYGQVSTEEMSGYKVGDSVSVNYVQNPIDFAKEVGIDIDIESISKK
jgi:hypothetical protein